MNKNYSVKIIAYAIVVVVAAESEEKALEYACDEVSTGDLEFDSACIDREIPDEKLEQSKKHAQAVCEPDPL